MVPAAQQGSEYLLKLAEDALWASAREAAPALGMTVTDTVEHLLDHSAEWQLLSAAVAVPVNSCRVRRVRRPRRQS
jgi:hypothetical protein